MTILQSRNAKAPRRGETLAHGGDKGNGVAALLHLSARCAIFRRALLV